LLVSIAASGACGRIHFAALGDADGTGDGQPIAQCPPFATFCDGFETGDTSLWPAPKIDTGGSLVVESSIVHTGRYALRGSMPSGSVAGDCACVGDNFAPITSGMFAVRAWVYQPQALINFDAVFLLYNKVTNNYLLVGGDGAGKWVASEQSSLGLNDLTSATVVPQNTWLCVELDYTFVNGAPLVAVYVDDLSVISATGRDPMPSFALAQLGVARTDTGGSTTILDDVVFATQHIGCT
jgi:hypothetical protein